MQIKYLNMCNFRENRTKVNITFNNNETITYMQLKSWEFEQSLSNGSLSDNVTTINIVINVSLVKKMLNILILILIQICRFWVKNYKPLINTGYSFLQTTI